MASLGKIDLNSLKYAELVKLAKEYNVYRRYAPKAELVEKLRGRSEDAVETLNDVSMPSFTESDTECDSIEENNENDAPNVIADQPQERFQDKVRNINAKLSTNSRESTPQRARRSLAGPARNSCKVIENLPTLKPLDYKMTRCQKSDAGEKNITKDTANEYHTRKLRRQATFEVENVKVNDEPRQNSQGTIEGDTKTAKSNPGTSKRSTRALRREGTFEIKGTDPGATESSTCSQKKRVLRGDTFDLDCSSFSNQSAVEPPSSLRKTLTPNLNTRASFHYNQSVNSRSSPHAKKISTSIHDYVKPIRARPIEQPVGQRLVTLRAKQVALSSPETRMSAKQSKIPSVMNEIHRKKAEVSAKKFAEASGEKPVFKSNKLPDFKAIHKRLIGKMESLVDSRQKVLERANSMQKGRVVKRSLPNNKVVRKLISPKMGTSHLLSPKHILQSPQIGISKLNSPKPKLFFPPSAFSSNIVAIQKRPSVGSATTGVSKLKSPGSRQEFKSKAVITNRFGFSKAEPTRKEEFKAAVVGRKPVKRTSPMSKAKQALQNVRLNKRFELQMKHRLAQQGT